MEILSHFPLSKLNTFGIEAFAKEFLEVNNDEDLRYLFKHNHNSSKPMLILGGGSNILFTGNYEGRVVKISTKGREIIDEDNENVYLKVAAGENWDELVAYCVEKGWGGLENLSGIPGQVGSSPIQNIGAYGTELKDHFHSLEGIYTCTGEQIHYDAGKCQFGYRDSIFKRALRGRVVISHVVFRLQKQPVINLTYQALRQKINEPEGHMITLQMVRDTVLQIRSSKLPDPERLGNAGSFFKNPVVNQARLTELKEAYPGIVYFEVSGFQSSNFSGTDDCRLTTDDFKLAAGWLIEQCGWKGFREGDAGVHKDQALVLVNYGKASGMDILELAGKIQRSVKDKFGVTLEREVNVV
jgi:UDP-N-acetylmuramate dehydrogenase